MKNRGHKMYVILRDGGKEYKVSEGDTLLIEKRDVNEGDTIEFDEVLLVRSDTDTAVGTPVVSGVKVIGEVESPDVKGKKILAVYFRRREQSRRKRGYRHHFTKVKIKQISLPQPATESA
jgi:large subunit ribosomal protein L21